MKTNTIWQPLLLMAIGLIVIVSTYRDYGITWDESAQSQYAEYVLDYFQTGGSVEGATQFLDTFYYGPLFDLTAAFIYQHAPASKYEIRHFLIALTGLATIILVYFFGRRLGGPTLGLYAALALAMMPRFYGHAFNNHKDIPFAAALTFLMFMLTRVAAYRATAWRDIIWVGLAAGCALGIRAGGMVIILILSLCIYGYDRLFRGDEPLTGRFALRAVVAFVIAWCCMVAPWPWAQQRPILNPLEAMTQAVSFPSAYPVLFEGSVYWSNQLPRYYLVKFLMMATPLVSLVLVLLGFAHALRVVLRNPKTDHAAAVAIVLTWLTVPPVLVLISRPNVYDGIRMFLFLLPPMALLAGLGAHELTRRLEDHVPRYISRAVIMVLLLVPVVSIVKLHPYQTTYFNSLVGGITRAASYYETEYWISSYKEATEWVNARVAERGETNVVVMAETSRLSPDAVGYYLAPGITYRQHYSRAEEEPLPADVDYYIVTTRFGLDANFPNAPVLHTIGREGAVFTVIKGPSFAP